MTHDETRDELARMDGWNKPGTFPAATGSELLDALNRTIARGCWWKTRADGTLEHTHDHPHAPTLDGANAAVPEGWTWNRWGCLYRGYHDGAVVKVSDHGRGHEMADMYALALACRRAMEEKR